MKILSCKKGQAAPIGATVVDGGVNFSVYSKGASSVELLLFGDKDDLKPTSVIKLSSKENRTYHYWHVLVGNIGAGQYYAYRVDGEYNTARSFAYDKSKVLIDPYAKGIYAKNYSREKAKKYGFDNIACSYKSVVVGDDYNWDGDKCLEADFSNLVIYELHIGGFTKSESSGVGESKRGTFLGVIDKIPYLKSLGINAVELLPVFAFDSQDTPAGKTNYWGYSPMNFFSIHNEYGTKNDPILAMKEFKDMVKALHKAGIEVILDVVYNHTSEANYNGPLQSMRGFDNKTYYILDEKNECKYVDYTGCTNTFNSNSAVSRRMIIDSLKYWVEEMHIDGFRFDLASILSRNEVGEPITDSPIILSIESEPYLAKTKLIAEAWDASGLYQLGGFAGDKWAEWNGKYRDDVRRFIKGDANMVPTIASRIVGSPDVFKKSTHSVFKSIHFVTCHDGFTLNDVVSYNGKHNDGNGENNMDGANDNYSWNCGIEGDTDSEEINTLRLKQIKNFFVMSFFSQGTPMILMGDEVRRTQIGNNNAYCQDNEMSWMDWNLVNENEELLSFVKKLISTSKKLEVLKYDKYMYVSKEDDIPYITWHGIEANKPNWTECSRVLGFEFHFPKKKERVLVLMNMYWENLNFNVVNPIYGKWNLLIDTSKNVDVKNMNTSNKVMMENRSISVFIDK